MPPPPLRPGAPRRGHRRRWQAPAAAAALCALCALCAALRACAGARRAAAFVAALSAGGGHDREEGSRLRGRAVAEASAPPAVEELSGDAKAWAETHFVDEDAKMKEAEFPIAPSELVERAKTFLALNDGFAGPKGGMMADNFEFAGPVVGPLNKQQYINSIAGFDFYSIFPDTNFEMYDFRVDVFEPSRVWFTSRGRGTNSGTVAESPLFKKATGKAYVNPPQTCSVRFNPDGTVNQYTVGYVMDRRVGNTGGLGGIYGILWAVGKPFPFPEARPRKDSLRMQFFNKIGEMLAGLKARKVDKRKRAPSSR